ncbi:MAG: hypothetical protein FWD09_04045 [Lentimicrobiaceae bacterium]|nr:hypothetical protein [Lentimicrobiaceae bacterium]
MRSKIETEDILKWVVFGLIFVITFPYFEPTYDVGLDPAYVWGFNWLFVHDYHTLTQICYPHGPLAFLKIPTVIGHNWLIFLIFYSLLKIGFIYLFFKLSNTFNCAFKSAIPVVLIVCFFVNVDLLIIGNCIILNLLFYKHNKPIYLYISAVLASLGVFIKFSIAIASLSAILVSILIDYYYNRNIIKSLKQIGIMGGLGLIIGLLIFHGFVPLFQYLWGAFKLSGGYDAVSLHPDNKWALVLPAVALILSVPFWNKEKDVRIAYLLCLLPLFAAWKHSFMRQDIFHYRIIICFLIVFWGLILLISKEKRILTFIVACSTVLLLYANMRAVSWYRGINREVVGVNNFVDVLHYRDFTQRIASMSERNVSPNKLTDEQKAFIGDQTIDIYPWDFSYIAANNFRWKPRRTLELATSANSQWASAEAAKNFLLHEDAPEFVLFHYQKGMESIDDRYVLSDEPLIMYNILNHYSLEEKTNKFMLFKKDTVAHFESVILEAPQIVQFNEWIDVPKGDREIIRLRVLSKNSLRGKVKKMLYKDGQYYIDYMLEDGTVNTYRYVSGTAVDGLWISPFIQNPLSDIAEQPDVVQVRLRNSHPHCIQSAVTVQFERIKLSEPVLNLIQDKQDD